MSLGKIKEIPCRYSRSYDVCSIDKFSGQLGNRFCPHSICSNDPTIRSNSFCAEIESGERSRAIVVLFFFFFFLIAYRI